MENKVRITKGANKMFYVKVDSYREGKRMFGDTTGSYYNNPDWYFPMDLHSLFILHRLGYPFSDKVAKWYLPLMPRKKGKIKKIKGLKGKPYKFQLKGIEHIENNSGRALIADQPGLGKTIQSLGWVQLHKKELPLLIVSPATLKINWKKEILKWTSFNSIEILSGIKPYKITSDIVIINYDILYAWILELNKTNFKILIFDEAHYVKNPEARRTKALRMTIKNIEYRIALTATPIESQPLELFNLLSIVRPELFSSYMGYGRKFCNIKKKRHGWVGTGAPNSAELNYILTKTVMIRRKKKDVLKDLPEKIHSAVVLELDNVKEYQKAERNIIKYIKQTHGKKKANKAENAKAVVSIETLKQLAVKGKMKQMIEWIAIFLSSGEKLVVFATHTATIKAILTVFPQAVVVDGKTTPTNKDKAVVAFQNDPKVNLFIGNMKAAGEGLTLTASSNVVFTELEWTSTKHEQAEDRCHRIGTKFTVNIYYLLAKNTIEEKILELLEKKADIIDKVIDGKFTYETTIFKELIKSITK